MTAAARDAARAAFLLEEAIKLNIQVGAACDGSEFTVITPRGMDPGLSTSFVRAVGEVHEAVIEHILRKNGHWPPERGSPS
jgi:hypothetical protein